MIGAQVVCWDDQEGYGKVFLIQRLTQSKLPVESSPRFPFTQEEHTWAHGTERCDDLLAHLAPLWECQLFEPKEGATFYNMVAAAAFGSEVSNSKGSAFADEEMNQ